MTCDLMLSQAASSFQHSKTAGHAPTDFDQPLPSSFCKAPTCPSVTSAVELQLLIRHRTSPGFHCCLFWVPFSLLPPAASLSSTLRHPSPRANQKLSKMPAERRSLRSNKSDASANGEAGRSNSQNSASNAKGKPAAPTRSASGRSKPQQSKKGTGKAAGGDQQQQPNGSQDPVENGVNNPEDVEMGDDDDVNGSATNNKQKQDEDGDGDDEMTVVVPPSKTSKSSGGADKDQGDVAMEDAEAEEAKKQEEKVNTAEKALTGKPSLSLLQGLSWVVVLG